MFILFVCFKLDRTVSILQLTPEFLWDFLDFYTHHLTSDTSFLLVISLEFFHCLTWERLWDFVSDFCKILRTIVSSMKMKHWRHFSQRLRYVPSSISWLNLTRDFNPLPELRWDKSWNKKLSPMENELRQCTNKKNTSKMLRQLLPKDSPRAFDRKRTLLMISSGPGLVPSYHNCLGKISLQLYFGTDT